MLRDEITREVNKDAFVLSSQIFNQRRPDQSHASNAQYDQMVRQRFLNQDREWLGQEAQRAPADFLESVKRIGARPPELAPPAGMPPAMPMPLPAPPMQPTLAGLPAPQPIQPQVSAALPSMPPAMPMPTGIAVPPPPIPMQGVA